ncbi:MAG TPA: alpha-glycosidase [Firmicutes bacterium]|nr:alpha-glycosidase [Bacillota bacterium]
MHRGDTLNQTGFADQERLNSISQPQIPTLPPAWASQAVFYQIFPERFCNGDPSNDPINKQSWGEAPSVFNFFGGDLKGIITKIPYLQQLGVTSLYLNPIFDSPSNHKYDTRDYLSISPEFGDVWTFKSLVEQLHQAGIRVIIDGVFNHTGDNFWAFQDIIKNGVRSRFKDWYHCKEFPIIQNPPNYECWWNFGSLPKLNHQNPEVVNYLLKVVAFWTSLGIDGWRLDVPNEVHMDFWRIFRKLVKSINPEAFIVGEIWDQPFDWLKGDTCDAVMNYRWRDAVIHYFGQGQLSAEQFRMELSNNRSNLPWEYIISAYNLLSSHDTPRFLTLCGENKKKYLAATAFQFTYPGIPALYYGDEVGMTGGKDPDCRKTMKWSESEQDQLLFKETQNLIQMRKQYQSLQSGSYYDLHLGEGVFGFVRSGKKEQVLACFNMNEEECRCIEVPREWSNGWEPIYSIGCSLSRLSYPEIPPQGVRIFKRG